MILVINLCKERLHYFEFVKPIEKILEKNKVEFFTKHFEKLNSKDVEKADRIVICGTGLKDNYFLDKLQDFKWIKKNEKPVLGICAGMQLLGLLHGGELIFDEEIGLKDYEFEKEFLGLKGKRKVYILHRNAVDLSKAIDLEQVAGKNYSIAFRHKEKEIFGILFHPEVRNESVVLKFAL